MDKNGTCFLFYFLLKRKKMKIIIKATKIKLSPALYDYIEKKIGGLEKFLKNIDKEATEARVEIGKPSQHHQKGDIYYAEVNLSWPGKILRVEASEWDLRAAVDKVKDELQREIKKYKDKQAVKDARRERSFKKAKSLSPFARFRRRGQTKEESW
ncbi:MAG: ribosomal subunit interface protein [Candidatus Portnoybacteria bacterium RIFCSPLOWO2_12_FULL_39_9]|uniref:Ribosomal subunit interface protein n=1 Tax=Candidatus Portnoybacteria bacterium RIFCSPHIGHO2_12_FULL_38_9 TaxID=1801997 RepID=A0A1G2FGF5_9BACT|nr:MAG: ribosomal subunit interface protein [Candidatus Portnoybacteria bacterium RBG_13_40_8]OGZ35760.1 MAG: ribosomal subunit interface protein [Candidatus Portnoybacteria bacterium RIFCSPHIGHO2_02_FULL_39_12]OGZ37135.1 MAG: ribosomal subunit interface protein [Candidatus Portnoybacteria bacterium RIFCSPHIGHO2_12_FULL_38_9]OGZ38197.1 MAG: ribosomal subunit interface protein [Candidatus Portnoybacteria bacterium RIFCSPLOWO2_01_FULL_38_39]OGZ39733.1 MAG: ribosomal subunit interface protein [Can